LKPAAVLTYKEAMPPNAATLDIERGKLDTLRLLPWQTDTSISIHSWGYVENDEYRTATSLIDQLVDTVAKYGTSRCPQLHHRLCPRPRPMYSVSVRPVDRSTAAQIVPHCGMWRHLIGPILSGLSFISVHRQLQR